MFLLLELVNNQIKVGVRMTDMETNMSDVEARPHRDGTRVVTSDANIQIPLLIVDIMIPAIGEDQIALSQINLSISGPRAQFAMRFSTWIIRYNSSRSLSTTTSRWTSIHSHKKEC